MYKRQATLIENVQRRATKLVSEVKDLPYSDRLKMLELPSIKYRQIRGDLIQTYKIINHIDNISKDDFFTFTSVNITRGSDQKLYKNFAKSKARLNFLPNRINSAWNSLSSFTKSANDLLNC